MLDILAVTWIVMSIAVLAFTRANRYLVLATLGAIVAACYCAAAVWMNGALSVALDDASARPHVRAALTFEVLAGLAVSVATICLAIAWRARPRRDTSGSPRSVVQGRTA
jgi:hypothetical protein